MVSAVFMTMVSVMIVVLHFRVFEYVVMYLSSIANLRSTSSNFYNGSSPSTRLNSPMYKGLSIINAYISK